MFPGSGYIRSEDGVVWLTMAFTGKFVYIYIYIYIQQHLDEHFYTEGHNGFLGNVSISLIDKTDGSQPKKRENY